MKQSADINVNLSMFVWAVLKTANFDNLRKAPNIMILGVVLTLIGSQKVSTVGVFNDSWAFSTLLYDWVALACYP